MGIRSRDLRRSDFFDAVYGPFLGLLCNLSPCRPFIAAVSCYSPNNHRFLQHLLRLSNHYCTAVTPIFLPWFDCSGISACSSRTGFLLSWFFITPLFLTLAPHDHVIYCQARGLSGHTSPCGEYVCFFWKTPCILKPKKFISFSRVWTLSGHTWSAVNKFSVLDLRSLHPYGKLYLGYIARPRFTLLGDGARCSATAQQLITVVGP